MSRKRGREQMEAFEDPQEPSLLQQIRNMWEFANLVQWIFIFGRAVKIDENLDVEDLETECLKSQPNLLPEIGLSLLKFVSSHRGLTPEIFDEYTRRQYVAKAPHRNPFGVEDEPAKFVDFDIFTKIRVLQQLTQWTMGNPDRIREKMEEQKDGEQTIWRIEPFGWDSDDRTYFVLDDNRLYRQTEPPPPPAPAPKPKRNSKKGKAALRASKRRKLSEAVESEAEAAEETDARDQTIIDEKEDNGLGGSKWECLAVTLDELNQFIQPLYKSRDPNEKILRKRLEEDLLPILGKQEEARKRKAAQKERELLNLEKLASAKRSSRIAGKLEHQRQEEEAREAERKKQADLAMAKKEQEKWMKLEKERESRMMTREQRVKEREARRILHEEELANLSEDSKKIESGTGRLSERHLKAEIERKKQALEELAEEEDWIFDCICGAYGQIDDGTHSIACEKCNIWQHSKCVGVSQAEADRDDFHFICNDCQRRAEDEERAKTQPPIKIRLNRPGSASSPKPPAQNGSPAKFNQPRVIGGSNLSPPNHNQDAPNVPLHSSHQYHDKVPRMANWEVPHAPQSNGISRPARPSPEEKAFNRVPSGITQTPHSSTRAPIPTSQGGAKIPSAHAFSSPHQGSPTNLPPPSQLQAYSFVNGNPPQYEHHSSHTPDSTVDAHRRSSFNLPSPLNGTPILTPYKSSAATKFPASSSPPPNPTPSAQPSRFPVPQTALSPPSQMLPIQQTTNANQASVLPPVATGYSPTKHSPPRPTTSNGSVGSATPSVIPPVASLSPSPRLQNLTPPVKPSEPDRSRDYSQSVGS